MAIDTRTRQSRRRLLAAVAGGVAALVAERLAKPNAASAAVTPVNIDVDNPSTALTSITQATADTSAFKAVARGTGTGLEGDSTSGPGVLAVTGADGMPAVGALQGDTAGSSWADAIFVNPANPALPYGAYGFSDAPAGGVGVVGETGRGIGIHGFAFDAGGLGMLAIGSLGAWIEGPDGAFVVSDGNGTGLQAHVGTGSSAPLPPANTAIFASVSSNTQVGLDVRGRVRFPSRSGRATIAAGKSSITVYVSGVTSSNFAIAVLNSSRSGRWVRAVVCSAGKIAIYLNTTVSSNTYVAWLVLG